jgi:predicted ATPase/DNA-binding winged helix-turn-helix (wHTH) protein
MSVPDPDADAQDVILFGSFALYPRERRLERDGRAVKVGSRALDVLIVLTAQAGEIISKEELTSRVWPDTVVEESTLRVHVLGLRKALADGQDGARYVANVPGRGYSFVAPVARSASRNARPTPSVTPRRRDLPAPLERIVGRDATIRELRDELRAHRFVTVVGPGGLGKTTVAIAAAHALADDFGGDVCFVDLSATTGSAQVATGIASALRLGPVGGDDVVESIVAFVRDRPALLVLDSCEHVIDAVAPLVERLVGAAPGLHVLATSREALRVRGEHVHRLSPLDLPPERSGISAAEVLRFGAVQLFVERATASGARLSLSDEDAALVADMCRKLDGNALAIEFAAARVDVHGVRGTASLLENRFKLFWHGRRTAVPRHQTLGALLDWSYNLLDEHERRILRWLSVFVGSFSLEAVAAVAAIDGDDERAVDLLVSLVDKSLVSFDVARVEGAHYRLLDTTRAYAQAKLVEAGERDAVARLHASWQCSLLERERRGDGDVRSLAEHLANTRAALEWCFSESGDRELGTQLAASAVPMFMELSLLPECQHWVEIALSSLSDAERGTRRELALQAALGVATMFTRGNSPDVSTALSRALALADKLDDAHEQLRMLGALHILLTRTGELRDALAVAERSEQVAARLLDDPAARLLADWMVGTTLHLLGDPVPAVSRCRTATRPTPISRSTAILYFGFDHRIRTLIVLARSLWLVGRAEDGLEVATQAVREAAAIGQATTVAISLVYASSVRLWSGDVDGADALVENLIRHAEKHSLGPYHMVGLALRGELAVKRGDLSGVEVLRHAIEVLHAGRHDLLQTVFATALAQGLAGLGRFAEALTTLDEAIASTERNGGTSFDLPEMLRVKGQLLFNMPSPDEDEAERYLMRAIEVARQQRAIAWELRAVTTLAQKWAQKGRRDDARALLQPALAPFEQGLDTADLRAANRLLSELS